MSKSRVSIEDLIKSKKDKKQIAILTHFFETQQKESKMTVTERNDLYEITVHHPSSPGLQGGAEQYFLDKKTGEWKMGWHEHPMKMRESIIQQKDPGDADTGRR
ncbi:MAG: hypothetical protein V1809_12475 [Planctomycetota bacterium]